MGSLFPDPTKDEQRKMRQYARAITRRLGRRSTDKQTLIEDVEQAGWEAFYRHHGEYQPEQLWLSKIVRAMENEAAYWQLGLKSYQGPSSYTSRKLQEPEEWIEWKDYAIDSKTMSVEKKAMLVEAVKLFLAAIGNNPGMVGAAWALWLEDGGHVSPEIKELCGVTSVNALSSRRKDLKRIARQVMQDAVPVDLNFSSLLNVPAERISL